MTITSVPFFRPSIGEAEIAEVCDSLRNGWLTTGAKAQLFEQRFGEAIGPDCHAVAVNSATAAMHLALEALGIGPGDEVIVPTLTFTATAEVVRYLGATPVLVDCDPDTSNVTADLLARAMSPRTKAVMPVHFAGLPCDMHAITDWAGAHGIAVVDDAAHAFPAAHDGRPIGDCGANATAFSFYANKTITTGEGGMLVTRDPAIAERARKMRLHGIDRDVFNRYSSLQAGWQYDIVAPGFKYNLTDIAASIGLHQLGRASEFRDARAALCERYDRLLSDLPLILPASGPNPADHSRHLYIVRLRSDAPVSRDELIPLLRDRGVGVSVHYVPLHRKSYWKDFCKPREGAFPHADAIGDSCVSLPLFPSITREEQDYVIARLGELLR